MKIKLAQYGISHDHASGKAKVMGESDDVDFCGVFEPSEETRAAFGAHSVYEGVHWFSSVEEMLEDRGSAGDDLSYDCGLTQITPYSQGVGDVVLKGVLGREHCGDTTLGVARIALTGFALRE